MTVENAHRFIKLVVKDNNLRERLNTANTPNELKAILTETGFEFAPEEMDQAHHNLLSNSQSDEEASLVNETKAWWDFINAAVNR